MATANEHDDKYLKAVQHVLTNGKVRKNRTGTDTRSVFGYQERFDLRLGFPLLTTKKIPFHSVLGEVLWFVGGRTDVKWLEDHKIKIWSEWRNLSPYNQVGDVDVGDVGPSYGFQWRHFGARYKGSKGVKPVLQGPPLTPETTLRYDGRNGQPGVDQLQEVIDTIKSNPDSRRMVVSAWNPMDLNTTALPPCHLMYMFNVEDDCYLNCHFIMRSCDVGLGLPFNIASYATLTHMVATVCGLQPGELLFTANDLHIYENHIPQLTAQLELSPRCAPELFVEEIDDIDAFTFEDFELAGYDPHPPIKMQVAV